ncbi:kinase-like domain-containing protein [Trichoderma chlorosporum]
MPPSPTAAVDALDLWPSPSLQTPATRRGYHGVWSEKDQAYANSHGRYYTSEKYLRGSIVGQGAWSVVYKVKRKSDGKLFAGKTACDAQLSQEIDILLKFSHDHVVKFVELHQQGEQAGAKILITELCAEGDLSVHIHHVPGGMGKRDILLVISQISDALAFIHGQNYYHSDIKPKNILIRSLNPMNVALADCADCRAYCIRGQENRRDGNQESGTYKYWSPEMAIGGHHDGKQDDIWALGISMLNMMAQTPHFLIYNPKNIHRDVRPHTQRCYTHAQQLQRLNPENGLVGLVNKMLVFSLQGRITAAGSNRQANALLKQMDEDGEDSEGKGTEGLQIRSPEDFKPGSFW